MYDFILIHHADNGETNLIVPKDEHIPDEIQNILSVNGMDIYLSFEHDHSGWWDHKKFDPVISLAGVLGFKWITTTVEDFGVVLQVLGRTWDDEDYDWLIGSVLAGDVVIVRPLHENGIGVIYEGEVLLEPIRV